MQNPIRDAFDASRIQDALDSIRAEQPLIERTRQLLVTQCRQPDLGARMDTAKRRQQRDRRRLVAALAFLVLTGIVLAGMAVLNTPIAAVSVDLDQAVTLQVNRLHRVVDVSVHASGLVRPPEQAEGLARLPAGLAHQTVEAAVAQLIAAAASASDSSIDKNGATIITLATAADSLDLQVALSQKVQAAAEQALSASDREAVLYMEFTRFERVEEAHKLDMTPGRLNLIQKVIELAPDTMVGDYAGLDNMAIMQLVLEKTQSGVRPDGQDGKSSPASGSQGKAPVETDGRGLPGSGSDTGNTAGSGSTEGNIQANGQPDIQVNIQGVDGRAAGNGADQGNGNHSASGQDGKTTPGSEPGVKGGSNSPQGSASGQSNGSGTSQNKGGTSQSNGSGVIQNSSGMNGNGDAASGKGNGPSNNDKSVKNGSGQETRRYANEAALQRIRQALARSAENARRNAAKKG